MTMTLKTMTLKTMTAAAAALAIAALVSGAALSLGSALAAAQANCRAASSHAGYVRCLRRMQEIYREQGQYQQEIEQGLNRTERQIDTGMQHYAPGYAQDTWNAVRGGYYALHPDERPW